MTHLEKLGNRFEVSLEPDADRYIGRECPIETCLGYFKVTRLAGEGQSAPQIAEPFGVHETTIYRCLATQESRPYGIYEPTDN